MASEQPNDGGAAFPGGLYEHQHAGSNDREPYNHGMTLRDWFAGQALAGAAGRVDEFTAKEVAAYAWAVADTMLAARTEIKK